VSNKRGERIDRRREADRDDPLGSPKQLASAQVPAGVDRRTFWMRSAVIGATALITGQSVPAQQRAERSARTSPKLASGCMSESLFV
jgi:hypothetical protein